jgi:hypothetical protein
MNKELQTWVIRALAAYGAWSLRRHVITGAAALLGGSTNKEPTK